MILKIYRVAHWMHQRGIPALPRLLRIINRIVFSSVVPPAARIGRHVVLSYQGLGTVIHRNAIIEDRAIIGAGVTIGGRSGYDDVPVVCEGALIGTGAKVLGPVRIGRFASIGANAVVLEDVPDYGVAVGIPAKTIKINDPDQLPDYMAFDNRKRH